MTEHGLREAKRASTERGLARTALDLARQGGIRAVTVDAIAQGAGVARRTFFNYFACKEEAIAAAALHRFTDALNAWEPPASGSVVEVTRHLVAHHIGSGTVEALVEVGALAQQHPQFLPFLRDAQWRMWLAVGDRMIAALGAPSDADTRQVTVVTGALFGVTAATLVGGEASDTALTVSALRTRLDTALDDLEKGLGRAHHDPAPGGGTG